MHEEFADVETDAAGTDHRHLVGGLHPAQQYIQIGHHHRVIRTGEVDLARQDAGGDHDFVVARQRGHIGARIQAHVHAGINEAMTEVAQRLVELLLAGDALGHIELAADLAGRIEQRDVVTTLGRHRGAGQTGRTGTDHRHALGCGGRAVDQFGFMCGARIDQAGRALVDEDVIQAGLVAGNAGVDGFRLAGACLGRPLWVGQQWACQRHHVGMAVGQHAFGDVGHVDAVHRDHRHVHVRAQFGGDAGECRTRH
ncbi:hypothetical protein D3C81_1385570 [compost metagenome]